MGNKAYQDMDQLRRDVVALIQAGRVGFTRHAEEAHPDIPLDEKRATVLHGSLDRPNRHARPGKPTYVCWFDHPDHGLLRAVYAVVEPPRGGLVLIITIFPE